MTVIAMTSPQNKHPLPASSAVATTHRLPCRGCLRDCPNYHQCDGKVWRLRTGKTTEAAQ